MNVGKLYNLSDLDNANVVKCESKENKFGIVLPNFQLVSKICKGKTVFGNGLSISATNSNTEGNINKEALGIQERR